jgi:hypothetical protein
MKDFYGMHGNKQKTKIKHYCKIGIPWDHENTGTLGPKYVTNTQSDTIIHNKIQTNIRG